MNGFLVALHDWKKILRSRKMRISVIAVLLIPLLYSYLYLWAFWDPYERLNELPVAVVNQDNGWQMNGEKVNVGQELVDKLKEDPKLKWSFLSEDKARKGLEEGDYYLMVQIPSDFSKKAASVSETNPVPAEISYIPNESRNLLSSQLGERAMESLKTEIQKKLTEKYTSALFETMGDLHDGFQKAADGANKLSDGLLVVKDGSTQLANGSGELAIGASKIGNGSAQLNLGLRSLAAGLQQSNTGGTQLASGLSQLSQKGQTIAQSTQAVASGTEQVNQALSTISPKVTEISTGLGQMSDVAKDANNQWQALLTQHPELLQTAEGQKLAMEIRGISDSLLKSKEGTAQLAGGISLLQQNMNQLAGGANQLATGVVQYTTAVNQLKDGAVKLIAGNQQLYTGAQKLAAGSTELVNGGSQLAIGGAKLQTGAQDLNQGVGKLKDGAQELASKLSDGAKEIQDGLAHSGDKSKMMSDPVRLTETKLHQVPNYGTGFSPYFISLALYVGALLLFIILDVHDVAVLPKRATSWVFGKFMVYSILGVLQAFIVAFLLQHGLGLQVVNKPMFYVMTAMTSLTFVVLIQFLISVMGEPGRFFAIVILMLQLTSSAGTFPLEMTPGFFQYLNPYLPMTYTVAGLKAVISNGGWSMIWENLQMLLVFFAGFVIVTAMLTFRRHPGAKIEKINAAENVTVSSQAQ